LPDAVFNFLTLLGWSAKDDSEVMPVSEIIERFSLDGIVRSPAKFDVEKCEWLNQQHQMKLTPEQFTDASAPFVTAAGFTLPDNFNAIAASVQEKVKRLTEVPAAIAFYLNNDFPLDPEMLDKVRKNEAANDLLTRLAEAFASLDDWSEAKSTIGATAKANGSKPGQLMFPTRIALSGQGGGPDLGDILDILGQEECVRRIKRAVETL
jgi:glutamyl-tRNA synthetase